MTDVYVTNVVRKVLVTPGATSGGGGTGGTNYLPLNNTWTGANTYSIGSAGVVPLLVKGASGQSAALTEWRDYSSSVLAAVDNVGQISTVSNLYVGRGVSAGGGNKVLVLTNATVPTTNPTGGGILYADSGALRYRDSSGAIHMPIPVSGTKGDILAHNGTTWVKISAVSNGYFLTSNSAQTSGLEWVASSGSGHAITQSGGSAFTQRPTLNFIGATVADDSANNRTNVTITASGASYYQTVKANGTARTQRTALNFGSMFTVTDDSGNNQSTVAVVADQAAGTASIRTLGSGATQAAAGDHLHTGTYDTAGTASGLLATHVADTNPHAAAGYITQATGDLRYASLASAPPSGGAQGYVLTKSTSANYAYAWAPNNATVATPVSFVGTNAATVPLTVQGASAQSTNLFQVQVNGGVNWFLVDQTGSSAFGSGANALAGMVRVIPFDASSKGVVVRGKSSQSGNLLETQTNTGTVNFSVGYDGTVTAPNIGPRIWVIGPSDVVPGATPGIRVNDIVLRST